MEIHIPASNRVLPGAPVPLQVLTLRCWWPSSSQGCASMKRRVCEPDLDPMLLSGARNCAESVWGQHVIS